MVGQQPVPDIVEIPDERDIDVQAFQSLPDCRNGSSAFVTINGNTDKFRTCATVWSISAVSVLVIDWMTTGADPPTMTPPTSTPTEWRRGKGEEKYPDMSRLLRCGIR